MFINALNPEHSARGR